MHGSACCLVRALMFSLAAFLVLQPLWGGEVHFKQGRFEVGEQVIRLRAVSYAPVSGSSPGAADVLACLYARDLPLIRATGANTVRTLELVPTDPDTWRILLETNNLYWLADFPLDPYYNPSRPLAAERTRILSDFASYAARWRGEKRLIGYVIGDQLVDNYWTKFAGGVEDFFELLKDISALLRSQEPEAPPLVAVSSRDPEKITKLPEGANFWIWNAGPRRSIDAELSAFKAAPAPPVVVERFVVSNPVIEGGAADAPGGLAGEMSEQAAVPGAIYGAFLDDPRLPGPFGIFEVSAGEVPGLDSLTPREAFFNLAAQWGGKTPAGWRLSSPPVLKAVVHAATGNPEVAPGALLRLDGETFELNYYAANWLPWPFNLAQVSLCVGGRPAPVGMIAPESGTAWLPWDWPASRQTAVLFRAGVASKPIAVDVQKNAPGIFPSAVVRAGAGCRVTVENGVRPGEAVEVYGTGAGLGTADPPAVAASVNGAPAEVLYAGASPVLLGVEQINLRLHPQTPPGKRVALQLQADQKEAPPYWLSVVAPEERNTIALTGPSSEIVVQAGGPPAATAIQAEGRNGYCGPVILSLGAAPAGLSFSAPVGFTGQSIPVEVRASFAAQAQTGAELVLNGDAPGAARGSASLRVTVLASLGDIHVRVVSGGFKAGSLARFDWNGRVLFSTTGGGSGRGINVMAVDAASGIFRPVESFDTWGDTEAAARLLDYLEKLPAGTVALFAVADEGSLNLPKNVRSAIAKMFGSRLLQDLSYQQSWAMIARKGAGAPLAEQAANDRQVVLEQILRFPMP